MRVNDSKNRKPANRMGSMSKEAQARIKINKLLEASGWRFFDDEKGHANIALEANAKLSHAQVDALGNDFETSSKGFIDFVLLDASTRWPPRSRPANARVLKNQFM